MEKARRRPKRVVVEMELVNEEYNESIETEAFSELKMNLAPPRQGMPVYVKMRWRAARRLKRQEMQSASGSQSAGTPRGVPKKARHFACQLSGDTGRSVGVPSVCVRCLLRTADAFFSRFDQMEAICQPVGLPATGSETMLRYFSKCTSSYWSRYSQSLTCPVVAILVDWCSPSICSAMRATAAKRPGPLVS